MASETFGTTDYEQKAELKVGGRACQCGECDLFFTGVEAFDLHRYGDWDNRKCRTPEGMRKLGMTSNRHGVWSKGSYKNPAGKKR